MNPAAYRDAMDRCSNPYEGNNQDVLKVTAGLDELSLKRQLPLRQHATKPMLKYNTSMNQSVHLFSQGDVGLITRDPMGINNYASNGMYYTGNLNSAHQLHVLSNDSVNSSQRQIIRRASNASNTSTNSNPYVRPVSATEVAANINGEKARKMVEGAIAVVSDKATDLANHTLQRNSFLRPLSGLSVNKDKVAPRKQTESPGDTPPPHRPPSSDSDSSFKQYNESKAILKSKFQFASTASTPLATPLVLKPDSKDNKPKDIHNTIKKSGHSSGLQNHRHAETIRNLHNKDDALNKTSNTYAQFVAQPYDISKKSITAPKDSNMSGTETSKMESRLEGTRYQKPTPDISEVSSLKKMPVTNTLTGTMYYRKASACDSNKNNKNASSSSHYQNSLSAISKQGHVVHHKNPAEPTPFPDSSRSSNSQISSKPPRPTFERSNASIQFPSKMTPQSLSSSQNSIDKAVSGSHKNSSKPPISHTKVKSSSKLSHVERRSPRQTSSPSKTPSQASSSGKPPSQTSSPSKPPRQTSTPSKPSMAADKQKPEHRPKADGAPAKTANVVDTKIITDAKITTWEDELYEENNAFEESEPCVDDEDEESETTPSGERLPGDGEASFIDEDFGDEDVDDALDNYEGSLSDGDSDGYSITSRGSVDRRSGGRPMTSHSAGAAEKPDELFEDKLKGRPATASNVVIKPALKISMFKNIPPTINFVADGEKTEQLPWELRKLLKWKMSPITPIVVRKAIGRIGFRISKRNHDWLGCFGKHMKAQGFKSLREYQKLNHFPGSFQIGRKDRLWRNLSKMQVHHGKREFNFFPHTFVLPADLKLLKRAWEDGNSKQKWIIKPPASARGIGIRVIGKWTQIPRRKAVIVQKYLARPYLINDSKFDMRIYVYVSSYDPLRVYVYEDGLARFASCKYSSSMKSLNNRYMHLTNYSVNKKNAEYQGNNADNAVCQGHKWSLKALWNYLKRQGHNTNLIWENIRDLIIKTIICGDCPINSMTKSNAKSRYVCHELFGFDILLDENLKPWILEVNISPSLHSNSQLDINIKGGMIKDMMNIAGFRIPDARDVSSSGSNSDFSDHIPLNKFCMDKRLFTNSLAPDERAKHAYYCQKHQDEQIMQSMLDIMTPDDIRLLTESIDEDGRKGNFQRLFPTPQTHCYLRFFEQPRYYNLLLDQWVMRYNRMEQRGILLLQSFCEEKIHLENPTSNTRHQWAPPDSTMATLRAAEARPTGSMNSARGSGSSNTLPRVLKKLPAKHSQSHGTALSQSSSTNSLHSFLNSSNTPSPIGPIGSPSR